MKGAYVRKSPSFAWVHYIVILQNFHYILKSSTNAVRTYVIRVKAIKGITVGTFCYISFYLFIFGNLHIIGD